MSKTFKALQRAAKERAAREGKLPPVPTPKRKPLKKDPPSAAAARLIAVQRSADRAEPVPNEILPPTPALVPLPEREPEPEPGQRFFVEDHGLRGEMEPGLRDMLEETFGRIVPGLHIGEDGWVQGRLPAPQRSELLQRYDLLHCLHRDEERSFWFWGSAREARDLAERSGYDLDPD